MQQHPVPQNITGFEFKLIGFLTLRQFGYLGAAAIFAFVLYSAKIPLLVVFLLAGPPALLAVALAFLPINGQPFERALAAGIKTVLLTPTVRVWHREPKVLGFLEPQFSVYLQNQNNNVAPRVLSDRSKLNTYLKGHKLDKNKALVDINEETRLKQLQFSPLAAEKEVFVAASMAEAAGQLPHFQRREGSS